MFGYLLVFSVRSTITLKITALVAYHVHVLLLNCLEKYRRSLIENEHTGGGFFQVREGSNLKDNGFIRGSTSSIY